jgi:hypothetical protein
LGTPSHLCASSDAESNSSGAPVSCELAIPGERPDEHEGDRVDDDRDEQRDHERLARVAVVVTAEPAAEPAAEEEAPAGDHARHHAQEAGDRHHCDVAVLDVRELVRQHALQLLRLQAAKKARGHGDCRVAWAAPGAKAFGMSV